MTEALQQLDSKLLLWLAGAAGDVEPETHAERQLFHLVGQMREHNLTSAFVLVSFVVEL